MVDNRNASAEREPLAPRTEVAEAAPGTDELRPIRAARLRVEEVEARIAPNAIWGD